MNEAVVPSIPIFELFCTRIRGVSVWKRCRGAAYSGRDLDGFKSAVAAVTQNIVLVIPEAAVVRCYCLSKFPFETVNFRKH